MWSAACWAVRTVGGKVGRLAAERAGYWAGQSAVGTAALLAVETAALLAVGTAALLVVGTAAMSAGKMDVPLVVRSAVSLGTSLWE